MERWCGKVALVTGASAGIGAAICEKFLEAGINVVGVARRVERVKEQAEKLSDLKGKLHAFQVDLTKEEDIIEAIKWTEDNVGPIHILVNNAGQMPTGNLRTGTTSDWRKCFDTNVIGLLIATREVSNLMIANNIDGHIVHINSVAGHKTIAQTNVYGATKYAVTNLTEVMRLELNEAKSKIKISSISPGLVKTEFIEAAEGDANIYNLMPILQPEDVADAVMYVIGTPPHVQIHELMIKPVNEMF